MVLFKLINWNGITARNPGERKRVWYSNPKGKGNKKEKGKIFKALRQETGQNKSTSSTYISSCMYVRD